MDQNSIYCPKCQRHTALSMRVSHLNKGCIFHISECNNCNQFFLVIRHPNNSIIKIYPQTLPKSINKKTPDFLKKDLEEVYLCFSVNAYKATGVMARRVLQLCCIEKGASGKKLLEQINWLLEKQIITKGLNNWANEVRLTGNDCAHPPGKINQNISVSREDAEEILILLDQFIKVLYIIPSLEKERGDKRKGNIKNSS